MSKTDSVPEITSEVVTLASSIHGCNTRFPSETNFFSTVVEHFLSSSNHAPNDMQVIPIKKVFPTETQFERPWNQTIDPAGLNILQETY